MNHWQGMAEFCRYEKLAGGPDPHMAVVGHLSRESSLHERFWRAGCYLAVYNVPTAELLWRNWSAEAVRDAPQKFQEWIEDNWARLQFRRERRAVRSRAKLARSLSSYALWMQDLDLRGWFTGDAGDPEEAYEYAWEDVGQVWGMGRYVTLKWCEFVRRYCAAPIELPDLRARGGWSPRAGLALLHPDHAAQLTGDDRFEHLRLADYLAERTRGVLADLYNLELDRYELQVLLCDYKQSAVGRRQYPGRSQDSELVYGLKAGLGDSGLWRARAELFPAWALGELSGWREVREPLGNVLADYGYTWSDSVYDWVCSRDDLERPVLL